MDSIDLKGTERDARFPSSSWTGFFWQRMTPGRHRMNIEMVFRDGDLEATGSDRVGPFTVSGSYDVAAGACRWIKQYRGKHQVTYTGVNQGQGIWGAWEITQLWGLWRDRGVFHIWPEGMNPAEQTDLTEEAFLGTAPPKNLI